MAKKPKSDVKQEKWKVPNKEPKPDVKQEAPKEKDETKIVPVKKGEPKDISLFDEPFEELGEVLGGVFGGLRDALGALTKPVRTRLPVGLGRIPVDITDKGKEIVVKVVVPGMTKDDVSVSIDGKVLTIEAEKNEEKEKKGEGFFHRQEIHSSFSKTVSLPADVKADEASGEIAKGVLTLTLPKVNPTKPEAKKIEVK